MSTEAGGYDGNRQTNTIPSLPELTRTLATNKYCIRQLLLQNYTERITAVVVNTLQIPLLSTTAQEQAFNSLGGEQSTAHCNCRRNAECNNVGLWRVSHLRTLNVLCAFLCSYRCCSAKMIYPAMLCIYSGDNAEENRTTFGEGSCCCSVTLYLGKMNVSLKQFGLPASKSSHGNSGRKPLQTRTTELQLSIKARAGKLLQ